MGRKLSFNFKTILIVIVVVFAIRVVLSFVEMASMKHAASKGETHVTKVTPVK